MEGLERQQILSKHSSWAKSSSVTSEIRERKLGFMVLNLLKVIINVGRMNCIIECLLTRRNVNNETNYTG